MWSSPEAAAQSGAEVRGAQCGRAATPPGAAPQARAPPGRLFAMRAGGRTLGHVRREGVGVSSKRRLVNLYYCVFGPNGVLKRHKVYTGSGRMPLRPIHGCCSCYLH